MLKFSLSFTAADSEDSVILSLFELLLPVLWVVFSPLLQVLVRALLVLARLFAQQGTALGIFGAGNIGVAHLDTLLDTVVAAVKKGDPVTIPGFGTFKQHARAARTGVNPSTGEKIKIAAAKLPKFSPGATFKAAVDPKAAAKKASAKAAAKPAAKPAAKKAAKPAAKKAKK